MRLWVSLLAAALVSCGGSGANAPSPAPEHASTASAAAPRPLPDALLQDLDGQPSSLPSFLHGRVALVAFWATWCDACFDEMDALNRLHAKASELADAVVVGVAVGEDRAKVAAFARTRGLEYPLLVDPEFALADALGERRVPTTLVIDQDARIVHRGGALDETSLKAFREAVSASPR